MNKINVINPIQFIFLFFFFHNDYFYLIEENCLEKNGESIRGENIEKKFESIFLKVLVPSLCYVIIHYK